MPRYRPQWYLLGGACKLALAVLLASTPSIASDSDVGSRNARGPAFGTTIISHGYQLSGSLPSWPSTLAGAIRDRSGGGRVFQYQPATGELDLVAGTVNEAGEAVVVFDWAIESNDNQLGRSEAAAEALLAALLEHSSGATPLIPRTPLHLIGHSRGTVVNSELAERLIALGIDVAQVTTLDPHDWGNAGIPGASNTGITDWDVNTWHYAYPWYDVFDEPPGIQTWMGVGFADNYFQRLGASERLTNPWGKLLPGTANLGFPDSFDIAHSDVHAWYHGTVDTAAATDGAGITIEGFWYDIPGGNSECNASWRDWTLTRMGDGFWFSLLGGGSSDRCPESEYSTGGTRVPVQFSYALPEGIVNGDFERDISGWSFHGGEISAGAAIGNGLLDLNLGATSASTTSATHNRFYIPQDRTHIRFCMQVVNADPDDRLRVQIGTDQTLSLELDQAATECEELAVSVTTYRDTVQTLTLELVGNGAGTARVFVDDVVFLPTDFVFRDGFEAGNSKDWTASVP